jgi:hypothetical protein
VTLANNPNNLYAVPASSIIANFEAESERIFLPEDRDEEIDISVVVLNHGDSSVSQPQKRGFHSTAEILKYIQEREQGAFVS